MRDREIKSRVTDDKSRNLIKTILLSIFFLVIPLFAQEGARYLIITHSNFYDCIQPLAQWKNQKGMKCKVATLSETGSTPDSIKNYIVNAYNIWSPRPEYILLVGHGNLVPSHYSSFLYTYTDNYYADVTGDYRAELAYGRFPCKNLAQCSLMVRKTLAYEKESTAPDSLWMSKGTGIVREDNDPVDDTIYWNNVRFVYQLMQTAGFTAIDSFSSQRGNSATDVVNSVNNGRGIVLYRGQGVSNWWSPFAVNPASTTNGTKLPIVASMTCQTMSMAPGESMVGEGWLRAGTVASPKGAVAFFGNTHTGSNIAAVRATATRAFFRNFFSNAYQLGKALLAAKESLYVRFPSQAYYEGLNLHGDPELNLLTQIPRPLTLTYPDTIGTGSQNVTIHVERLGIALANALVCLWKGAEVYSYGYTNALGNINFSINPLTVGDVILTATARNSLPFEGIITCFSDLRDVGTTMIISPPMVVDSGFSGAPACTVYNYGTTTETYRVHMKIGAFYNDTVRVLNHAPGMKYYATFPICSSWQRGNFAISCSTELLTDMNSANDKATDSVLVRVSDVGVIAIASPPSIVTTGTIITPACTVYNYGTTTETYRVRMKIGAFYHDSATISNHAPGIKTFLVFPSFTLDQIGTHAVSCSTELSSDLQPINDKIIGSVDVQSPGWTKKADVRGQPSGKNVKSGGGITKLDDDIYLILGNNKRDFMRFSISSNTWTPACSIPAGSNNKKVKKGASIINDGNFIYVLKGGGTNEFYRYDPTTNSWNSLPSPNFIKGVKGGFTSFTDYGGSKYIYCGSGSNNNEWKRFNLSTDAWENAFPNNLPVEKAKAGSSLVFDGANTLYFLLAGGKENDFYITDLSSPSPAWSAKKDLPLYRPASAKKKKIKEGGALEYYNGIIYAVKGGNTKEFWCYIPEHDSWAYINEVGDGTTYPPVKGIKCGRSLTASDNGIYCLIGNKTNEFWFYGSSGTEAELKSSKPTIMAGAIPTSEFNLTIKPNPSFGKIRITYESPIRTTASLIIYNILGKIVYSENSDDGSFTIEHLPAGIYFTNFNAGSYNQSKKLVVTR